MDRDSEMVAFPLLAMPIESNYRACTISYRFPSDDPRKPTPTEIAWIDLFRNSIPSFKKRAESDTTVDDAPARADKFAQRYADILDDLKKDPESHGGPPDCILLCRIREQILRELGFRDIFKKVKDEENAKAISLFPEVVRLNDNIEDEGKRLENLVRGIFAGNIFDLGSATLAEVFSRDGMSFLATCQNLVPRPWVIDDFDTFQAKWSKKSWKKAVIFVDNSGADVILGILPFARELLKRGTQVVLAANDLPSINDITYPELVEIISKDESGKLIGVDTSNLLIANSGNDLPVIDLTRVSQELAYLASDADLVILEGMGRGIETNLYAQFKCDSLKIGMVKHPEVAEFLGGRLYDCVFKYNEVSEKEEMESDSEMVAFPLLESNYTPCTIPFRVPSDNPLKATPTEVAWIDLYLKSIPSFKKAAETDTTVADAPAKADKFAQRYAELLDDIKKDPESHGGPPDSILLCRLREQVLRELGFRDVFKKVKDEENAKAMSLFPEVVRLNDDIEDGGKRVENLVRGIFAGNIFDLGSAQLAEAFSRDGMSFLDSFQNLVPRPWVIDDLDAFKAKWIRQSWKKAVIFVDNSGVDVILGILPFARELLKRGTQVVLAANDVPCINDVTYLELVEIISKLKDESGKLIGVDTSNLLIANSGSDLPVIDLTRVSQELAYLASDADLVILEGNGRGIETNLYAQFKCDSLKTAMVKHPDVAQFLGGRLYDCVFKYNEVLG